MKRLFNQESITAYLFILPSLIGFLLFFAIPSVRAVQISFTDWNLLRAPNAVGLENYQDASSAILTSGTRLKVTFLYVLYNIPLQTILGLFIAVVMDRVAKSIVVRGNFRAALPALERHRRAYLVVAFRSTAGLRQCAVTVP